MNTITLTFTTRDGTDRLVLNEDVAIQMELLLNVLSDDGIPNSYGRKHSDVGDMLFARKSRSDLTREQMRVMVDLHERYKSGETYMKRIAAKRWYES